MGMSAARNLGMCGLLVLGAVGCGKVSQDHSKVIATVNGEKITQAEFDDTVRAFVNDKSKAEDLLNNPAQREQRNQLLASLVSQKSMLQYAKAEGLDRDPRAQVEVAAATAEAYFLVLADRSTANAAPTEEQLKSLYAELAAQATMAGQGATVPPYEQVQSQLPEIWKRRQDQRVKEQLLTTLRTKYPVTFDGDYRPSGAP